MSKLFTDSPYQHDIFTIKHYGEHIEKIAYIKTMREAGWEDERETKAKGSVNDDKLSNNLARAKTLVKEYALCNPWDYWCTFTISPDKFNRYNLNEFYKHFAEFIHGYNKRQPEAYKVKYLLVPEQHKDGAWHMHGFIKGINPKDLLKNENGYMTWKQYNRKFGFISMDVIKDMDKASSYILKYMTKDTDKNVTEINKHVYYCSKGLQRAVEIFRGRAEFHGNWDWEHPDGYCKIKTIDLRKDNIHDYIEVYDNDYAASF